MCILFVYFIDGFPKKVWMGVGGWDELYPVIFWIFGICLTLQSPLTRHDHYNDLSRKIIQDLQ